MVSQYWGYCKYRYRDIWKPSFAAAKTAVLECLNSCPLSTIRKFINRAWRFMDAYRSGLTGKAAEWAVKKQKGHRTASGAAMAAMEAILN
jgi:hypothetical protein